MKKIICIVCILIFTQSMISVSWAQSDDESHFIQILNQMQMLSDKAGYAYSKGNYIEAANYSGKTLSILKREFGHQSQFYVNSAIIHASHAVLAGDKETAIRIGKEAVDIQNSLPDSDKLDRARTTSIFSDILLQAEEYEQAIAVANEVYKLNRSVYGENSVKVIPSLRIIAEANLHLENFSNAVRYSERIVSIQMEQHASTEEMIKSLLTLFDSYVANKQDSKAVHTMDEVYEYAAQVKSSLIQYNILERVPTLLYIQGHLSEIIEADENIIKKSVAIFGKNSQMTLRSIENLLFDCYKIKQYEKAPQYVSLYVNLVKQQIADYIIGSSLSRQAGYWENFAFSLSTYIPFIAFEMQDEKVNGDVYNALIISKSFLLESESRMRNFILHCSDKSLKKVYDDMLQGIRDLHSVREIPVQDRPVAEIDIQNYIDRKQDILYSKIEAPITSNSWVDIQKKLQSDEAAIELTVVQDQDKPSKFIYMAYVITPQSHEPVQLPLFDLISWYDQCICKNPDRNMYNLFWKPLEPLLKGMNKLYVSPTGVLWKYPFEHCLLANTETPLSHLKVYRVSSTAEILKSHNPGDGGYALFGGMQYNITDQESLSAIQSNKTRGSLDDISYTTLHEVQNISELLSQHQKKASVYIGLKANEKCFKLLSGSNVKAIHVATHGFYWGKENSRKYLSKCPGNVCTKASRNMFGSNEEALSQCGLLFSGAKNTIQGSMHPFEENGILIASEISSLDFHTTDMVILSACQTGLGTTNVEGVWGLVRAFKRAGVNSLLTTLWSVDDDATHLFMVNFYNNWLNGKTKVESLRLAQQYVKNYEVDGCKIYSNPKYWAGFTLLDALN